MKLYIKTICSFLVILSIGLQSTAQVDQVVLFEGKFDEELLKLVQDNYTPAVVYDYSQARDIMYGVIDNHNDTVTCVYTGYSIYIEPNSDPSDAALAQGINTEHIYPRSKGAADGNAKSDMHHLVPSLDYVNSRRSNLPYYEIPDTQTDFWYRHKMTSTTIPREYIDEYSEASFNYFEPREDIKGDIARAVFYFYSIYRDEAVAADNNFFQFMRKTLYAWHKEDPVDQAEMDRTLLIKLYQDNKPNPFVLDSTLATRLYCEGSSYDCTVSIDENFYSKDIFSIVEGIDNNKTVSLSLNSTYHGEWLISVFDAQGKLITQEKEQAIVGKMNTILQLNNLNNQLYFIDVKFIGNNGALLRKQSHKLVLIN